MAEQYVLQDRTTLQNYALKIVDREPILEPTADAEQPDIIVEDAVVEGNFYEIYVDDGELLASPTLTEQDDEVLLDDAETDLTFKPAVLDGELQYVDASGQLFYYIDSVEIVDDTQQEVEILD